jgi:hypothetical protein
MIYTIGDSTCWIPLKSIPKVKTNLIFSSNPDEFGISAYTFATKPEYATKLVTSRFSKCTNEDYLIYFLGGVDCRITIATLINETNDYISVIDYIAENMFKTISQMELDINICMTDIVPILKNYSYQCKLNQSIEDGLKYIKYFNFKKKELSKKYNYLYVDVCDKYTDNEGYLSEEISDHNIHIKDPIHYKEFFKKYMNY